MSETSATDSPELQPGERLVSLDEALEFAQKAHRTGHFNEAAQIYQAVLKLRPEDPNALHFYGILRHHQGASAEGVELIKRAAALMPDEPGPRNNLANVLLQSDRIDEAEAAYLDCTQRFPDFADPYNNLGLIAKARKQWDVAERHYARALELRPDWADVYNNLANLMLAQNRINEAVQHCCRAITLRPADTRSRKLLGFAYSTIGETEKAAQVYRDWLAEEPDNPTARHHLAACTGEAVPERASDAYVEATFDSFANSFDAQLARLEYRAPELVAELLDRTLGEAHASHDILDAGCGTGLVGPLVRAHARSLVGIDLSGGMLDHARQRQVYDTLEKAELVSYLAAHPAAFDVVLSADTLCYFGELTDALQAAAAALRADGVLVFTVEAFDNAEGTFHLQAHGRYAHARGYVSRCVEAAGLALELVESVGLRFEGGVQVKGWLVLARKRAG